jgi:hypothetical protein
MKSGSGDESGSGGGEELQRRFLVVDILTSTRLASGLGLIKKEE